MKITGNPTNFEKFKSKYNAASREFEKIFNVSKLSNGTLTQAILDICGKYDFKPKSEIHYIFKGGKFTIKTALSDSETGFQIEVTNSTDIDVREASIENLILLFDQKLPDQYQKQGSH